MEIFVSAIIFLILKSSSLTPPTPNNILYLPHLRILRVFFCFFFVEFSLDPYIISFPPKFPMCVLRGGRNFVFSHSTDDSEYFESRVIFSTTLWNRNLTTLFNRQEQRAEERLINPSAVTHLVNVGVRVWAQACDLKHPEICLPMCI